MIDLASLVPAILQHNDTVPEEWSQGRTAYGGLLGAIGMAALREVVPADRQPRSLFVQFLGPIPPGQNFDVVTEILSSGKSMTVAKVTIAVEGRPSFLQVVTYAVARESVAQVTPPSAPEWPAPETLQALPFLPKITPNFTQAFAYRWAEGPMPFSGSSESHFGGYFAYKGEPGPAEVALVGMLDAWPPAVLPMLKGPAPASTVSWSAHLLEVPLVRAEEWWSYRARTAAAGSGTATTQAKLYAPDGRLVALSEQLVAVYG